MSVGPERRNWQRRTLHGPEVIIDFTGSERIRKQNGNRYNNIV